MKPLRNPVVVGALALIAVVVMLIQFGPRFKRSKPSPGPQPDALPVPAPAPQPVASASQAKAAPGSSIDIPAIEARSARWNNTLQKDPFQTRTSATQGTNAPAWEVLKLSAVWRQTQQDLAVINNLILTEGEQVLQFKVYRIEPDGVWVDGPNGRELIGFASSLPSPTNAVPPAAKPGP